MASTCRLQSDKLDELSTSDSRSKQKEKKTVGENKAMIGARHGYDFVDLITMAIILKAGSMMKEDELFSCEISKEDATAGKFDDIVFRYTYKGSSTILKIQVKHRTKNQEISLQELMETSFTEPFALIKYFKSFLDQYTQQNDNQMFILCTNVQVNNDAAGLLEKVRPNDVCNIFDPIGAIYYRCRKITQEQSRDKKCIANALKKASESYRLAELLAIHIHGQKELVLYTKNLQRNPPLSKYNNAIVRHMIDYSEERKAFHINHNFISNTDLTVINFRKQFENAYTEIATCFLKKKDFTAENFDVYGDITKKGIKTNDPKKLIEHIRNIDQHDTPEHFPTDIITDDDVNLFFDKFLIVCDTFSTDDLPSKMAEMWRDSKMCKPTDLVCSLESEKYIEGLHRTVSNWMKSSPNLPTILEAKHVEEIIKKVKLRLKYLLLKKASNKYIADHHTQSLRAKPESLREKPLYKFLAPSRSKTTTTEPNVCTLSTPYNSQFSSMIVLQTFQLHAGNLDQIVFIDANTIENEKQIILDMCESFEDPLVMVIECEGYVPSELNQLKQTLSQSILANRHFCIKIILLNMSQTNTYGEEVCFILRDFEPSSIQTVIRANEWNTMFGTSVPTEVFMQENDDMGIILNLEHEQHKALQDPQKQCMVDDHYENIRHSYVQRHFKHDTDQFDKICTIFSQKLPDIAESVTIPWESFFEKIHIDGIRNNTIENMKYVLTGLENKVQHILPGDEINWQKKVHILLGEAGCGKSSYLSWLGWYLQNKDRSSWVIRFNAIDYCTDFKRLANEKEQLNNTEAMRLLYRMIHLALFVRKINQKTISTTDEVRKEAEQCADLLEFDPDPKAIVVNEEKWKTSEMTSLQLIMVRLFQDKFNDKSLIVLFDGFDEIIPHYRDVVFNLLARIQEFDGIKGMYVTSRPYNLHKEFKKIFSDAKMHSFASFTQTDRLAALHMFMRRSFPDYTTRELEQQVNLLGSFLHTIEILLKDLGEIPIYLTMAMEVLKPLICKCVNFNETTINTHIMKDLKKNFEKLHLIEQFVENNLLKSNFEKTQMTNSVRSKPTMKIQLHRANKQMLRMHSVLALYVIFDANEREKLHINDTEALEYMEEIKRGDVKTGIIEAIFDSKPLFIHRSFAEYFAAVWLFDHRDRDEVKRFLKSFSYWAENRIDLREYFDRKIIIESTGELPIHMAIVDSSLEQIKELLKLKDNDAFVMEKDLEGRTVLHLMAITCNHDIDKIFHENQLCWPHLNEKDEILNWSALDYALMAQNIATAISLIKFGAQVDLSIVTDVLLAGDGEELLKNLICIESVIVDIANSKLVDIVETFEMEVVKRVLDFAFKREYIYLSDTLFEYLLKRDAVITLKTLCDRDPELFSTCRMKKLLIKAFKWYALDVVEYLVVECQYDIPLDVENHYLILERSIVKGCNELFTTVFKSYCLREGFEYNDLQPGATRNQDNLRRIQTTFMSSLLGVALKWFNMFAIDYLLHIIPPEDCNDIFHCTILESVIYVDEFMQAMSRIKYFIGKSTGIMHTNREGTTLLHYFIQTDFFNLALTLIEEYGFQIGQTDTQNGWNAFHYCAKNVLISDIEEYNKLLNYMLAKKDSLLYLSAKDKQGRNVLHLAVENYNICTIKIILQKKFEKSDEPNRPAALVADILGKTSHQLNDDTKGMTLLHYVIGQKHYMLAKFLIEEYGLDIGQTDTNNGWNALHYCAIDKESWPLFEHMLTKDHVNLHLSAKDKQGRIVLHHAVINGNAEIAQAIIQRKLEECNKEGPNWPAIAAVEYTPKSTYQVNNDAEGMTLLQFAIASGQYKLGILLIQKYEFDIGETDARNGWNALHYCAHIRFPENMSIPKEYADLLALMMSKKHAAHLLVKDKQDRNVLHVALINENTYMVHNILQMNLEEFNQNDQLAVVIDRYIIETTDLLEGDGKGMTLLHFAIESELYGLAVILISTYGYDVRKTNTRNGWNAFHYCANCRYFENPNSTIRNRYSSLLFHMMMKENATLCLSAEDAKGRTVMDIALKNGNFLIACYILREKLIESNELGRSASTQANYIGETSDLLEANVEGMTLLHFAIASECYSVALFLIVQYGFDIGKADTKNGWNVFHYCAIAEKRYISLMPREYLNLLNHIFANKHADLYLSAKDKQGRNVLHIALINQSFLMARVILYRKRKELIEKDHFAPVHVDYIGEATHLLGGNGEGMSLLHLTILSEEFGLAIFLIEECGVNIGITNPENGWNAFHCYATIPFPESGAISIQYKKLLDCMMAHEHADLYLSAEDKHGRNPLQLAAINFNFHAIKYILQKKFEKCNEQNLAAAFVANILGKTIHQLNDDTKGMTLLHYVIGQKYYMLAKFLIEEYGLDIGETDTNNGWNAFHYCANFPFKECSEEFFMLLQYMQTKDRVDSWIAFRGHLEVNVPHASMLLEYMLTKDNAVLHLSAIDLKGRNVLHYAVINGNIAIAYAVLETMLKECNKQDHPATLIDNYIRETTDLLEGDAEGMTLLHFAIVSKQYELAVFLVNEYGFDIGKTNTKNGWNAFHYLANICISEANFARSLLLPVIPNGYTYLFECMMAKDHSDRYSFATDKQGRNVIHISIISGNFVIAALILKKKSKESNEQDRSASEVRFLIEAGVYGSKKCHNFLIYFNRLD